MRTRACRQEDNDLRPDPYRKGRLPTLASLRTPIDPGIATVPSYASVVLRLHRIARKPGVDQEPGEPLEEYKSLCEFLRLYSTLRFYQLALLLGTSSGIATALLNPAINAYRYGGILLRLVALIIAFALTVMDVRSSSYWHFLRDRANALCARLRFEPFPTSTRWSPFTTSGAAFYLHASVSAAWATTLLIHAVQAFPIY